MALVALAVPAAALAFSLTQERLYRASAQVLLNTQNLAATTSGPPSVLPLDPRRIMATQATVARAVVVARSTLRAVPATGLTARRLLAHSSVSKDSATDILTFQVADHDPALAGRLARAYASAYIDYRRHLDTGAILVARADIARRLARLGHRPGGPESPLAATLVERDQALAQKQALQSSNASLVDQADPVVLAQPLTIRNVGLGIVLGLALALGAALLLHGLDTRVRDSEISERLGGVPLLARIPAPGEWLETFNRLAMLADPDGLQAHAFRLLRSNLNFVTLDREVRVVMVTSTVEGEGKSTTVANLALALARAGRRVVLVDLDLRRPIIGAYFGVAGPGLTQVALGKVPLERALVPVTFTGHGYAVGLPAAGASSRDRKRGSTAEWDTQEFEPIQLENGERTDEDTFSDLLASLRVQVDGLAGVIDTAMSEERAVAPSHSEIVELRHAEEPVRLSIEAIRHLEREASEDATAARNGDANGHHKDRPNERGKDHPISRGKKNGGAKRQRDAKDGSGAVEPAASAPPCYLEILPAGGTPPDPGMFVGTRAVADILSQLRERAEIVLIDAPPTRYGLDATTLSARVDGIVVVAKSRRLRRSKLAALRRALSTVPTPVLGYVLTNADREVGHLYDDEGAYPDK